MASETTPAPSEQLVLRQDGRWSHDGQILRHERLSALLHRSIARDEEGRLMLTTGRDRLSFESEDAPYSVRTARVVDDDLVLVLSDGSEERLAPGAELLIDEKGRVRSRVKGGAFWALWRKPATQALTASLEERQGELSLPLAGGRAPLVAIEGPRDWTS
jgi:hypothetical protein